MTAPPVRRPKRPPSVLDDAIWDMAAGMFGARLGFAVPTAILGFTRAELEREGMTTNEFEFAAAAVLRGKLYAAFPGVDEFWDAISDRTETAPYTPPGIAATQRLIAAGQAPPPSVDALEQFAADWRRVLAHCAPTALREARKADPNAPVWRSDPTPPRVGMAAEPAPARPVVQHAPAPVREARRSGDMTPLGALVGAALRDFAPIDESDVIAR